MGLKRTTSAALVALLAFGGLASASAEPNDHSPALAASDAGAVVGDRLLVIHDSVILGARSQIETTFPDTKVQYIGFGGLRVGPAADILASRPDLITDKVVVELGTNYLGSRSLFRRELDRLMGLLAGVDHVLWLTPSRYTGRMDQVHTEIRAAARRYPNLQVGEWTQVTAVDPLLTWNDGIHLRSRGADAIATLIRRHLEGEVPWNRIPFGRIERILDRRTGLRVAGWAHDPDLGRPARVRIIVDGKRIARVRSAKVRRRVGKFLGVDDRLGFKTKLKLPDGKHQVCIEVNNFDGHDPVVLGCRNVSLAHEPVGAVERVVVKSDGDVVRGWAYDPDRKRSIHVDVVSEFEVVATTQASRVRIDLAGITNGEQRGFAIKLPAGLVDYCLVARNELAGINDTVIGCY